MRICLDTSGYSAFLNGRPEAVEVIQRADEIVLSAVALGELLSGFLQGSRSAENRARLEGFLESPRARVVRVDEETAERYADILAFLRRAGSPVPTNDLWIAASAMQYGLVLVTSDAHFGRIPQVSVRMLE